MITTTSRPNPEETVCVGCREPGRLYLRHGSVPDVLKCPKCGLLFADSRDYGSEAEYEFSGAAAAPTSDEKTQFARVFSERIDTSDALGNMYPDFGISQKEMEEGIFESVREMLEKHGRFSRESAWNALDVGCATGFLLKLYSGRATHKPP